MITADLRSNLRSETTASDPDGFTADGNATLGWQILDIAQAQGKPMAEPDGLAERAAWKAVAFLTRRIRGQDHLMSIRGADRRKQPDNARMMQEGEVEDHFAQTGAARARALQPRSML